MMRTSFQYLIVASCLLFLSLEDCHAAKLSVENNGSDSNTCGESHNPCRSISQAIENANGGDTIIVGPGIYGDINHDNNLGDAGEEFGSDSSDAAITVEKALRIISSKGARSTLINISESYSYVFRIFSASTIIGGADKGFTISRAGAAAIAIDGSQVKIIGNRINGNQSSDGIYVGCANTGSAFRNDGLISNNEVTSTANFGVRLCENSSRWKIVRNDVSINVGTGISVEGTNNTIRLNYVLGNQGYGILIGGDDNKALKNIANGNDATGITSFDTAGLKVNKNSAIGNASFGIFTNDVETVIGNNLYGNNILSISNFTNCGLFPETQFDFNYNGNYWGSPDGVGFSNGANGICSNSRSFQDPSKFRKSPINIQVPKPRT